MKPITVSSDRSLWQVDLRSLGYPQNNPDLQRRRGFANFDTISFLSDGSVAATFVTREEIPELQRREDPSHIRPYRLHAIFLDSAAGNVLHTLDWPIENPNAGIFPRTEGGFLLLTTERIVSYSADWTQMKELPLSDLHSVNATLGGISQSPSTKFLVIQFVNGNSARCLNIRTDSLAFSQIPCGIMDIFTASDDRIVAPQELPESNASSENKSSGVYVQYGVAMPDAPAGATVLILNPDQARTVRTICNPCVGMPQFINNEMLAVYSPTYISVVDRSGKVSFTQSYYAKEKWIDELGRPVRASANGQRFAIVSNASQFRNFDVSGGYANGAADVEATQNAGDMPAAIANARSRAAAAKSAAIHMSTGDIPAEFPLDVQIYDLSAGQWIYILQINANHLRQVWGLALSPNGNQLAVDSGGTIQFFALPPRVVSSPK